MEAKLTFVNPYFNTNDDEQNWFQLDGDRNFCKFASKKDGSRIYVLLATLYGEKPTLSALAYYAKVPFNGVCDGNPASCYCLQLGGSDLFGESISMAADGCRNRIQSTPCSKLVFSPTCHRLIRGD